MNKKKCIAVVSGGELPLPPVRGGAAETLTDMLIRENEEKHNINFVVYSIYYDKAVEEKYHNTKCIFVKINYLYNVILQFISKVIVKMFHHQLFLEDKYYASKVKKAIKNSGDSYDYILIENNARLVDVLEKVKVPMILHLHNEIFTSDLGYKKGADKCRAFITVSEYISKKATQVKNPQSIFTLKNCIEVKRFRYTKEKEVFRRKFRNQHGICSSDIVCVFSGRIHETKGVYEILRAFEKIKRKDIYLLIIGGTFYSSNKPTPYSKKCADLALKLGKQVILTGYVDYASMPYYYSIGDIGLMPSLWNEPACLVQIEMQAAGLPLICTQNGGTPEYTFKESCIFVHNETLVDDLYNAIMRLADDSDYRKKLASNAPAMVKNFNEVNYYKNFCEIIEKIDTSEEQNK